MEINIMAVLVAVVANFVFGYLWFTPLFGKAWAKENKFDTSVKPPTSVLVKGMIFMVIGNFLMAYVFAHNIMAWTYVPGMAEMPKASNLLSATIFTWLGFYVPTDLSTVAWEGKSWKLFAINTVYHFLSLLIAALIIMNM